MTVPVYRLPRDAARVAARLKGQRAADAKVRRRVEEILSDCERRGTQAVLEWTKRLDGVELAPARLEVSRREWDTALREVPPDLAVALRRTWKRLYAFHKKIAKSVRAVSVERDGVRAEWRPVPVRRAGLYVPGGEAPLFSTLLMTAAAARAAGVGEVVVCTPPGKNGEVPAPVRYAARLAGVDRLFRVGGVQAVAAAAFGIPPVPRVDVIAGPGNRFVAEAKRQLFGRVGIDAIAGPSEVFVVASGIASARAVAWDLLAQAEHGTGAERAVLATPSRRLAEGVLDEVEAVLSGDLPTAPSCRRALSRNGAIVVTPSLAEALALADETAPEHLILHLAKPPKVLPRAGAVFLAATPEVLGDYNAGPNHVLPTGGTARFASALSPLNFLRFPTTLSATNLRRLAPDAIRLAEAEGLPAHVGAIAVRL